MLIWNSCLFYFANCISKAFGKCIVCQITSIYKLVDTVCGNGTLTMWKLGRSEWPRLWFAPLHMFNFQWNKHLHTALVPSLFVRLDSFKNVWESGRNQQIACGEAALSSTLLPCMSLWWGMMTPPRSSPPHPPSAMQGWASLQRAVGVVLLIASPSTDAERGLWWSNTAAKPPHSTLFS